METPKLPPTDTVPHWHYICIECKKPVATEQAWYASGTQLHFDCMYVVIGRESSKSKTLEQPITSLMRF